MVETKLKKSKVIVAIFVTDDYPDGYWEDQATTGSADRDNDFDRLLIGGGHILPRSGLFARPPVSSKLDYWRRNHQTGDDEDCS